jgi:NAD(P)-dependent dehydrogenase (short-subunit alcohol dehydrogenase family)
VPDTDQEVAVPVVADPRPMASAIVIGAGPGIGAAVARRLAREGLAIGAIARTGASPAGLDAATATADVTDEAGLRAALDELVGRIGAPELLIYNAALIRRDRPGELSARGQLDAYAVNVVGALTAAAHLAPRMAPGATIAITGGLPRPDPAWTSLSLGKAAVRALVALLDEQYGPAVRTGTVTIAGTVARGTAFDPDAIAERYWQLHVQPRDRWRRELVFSG